MLTNARGTAIITNTVTPSTFRGPAIVACSADYTSAFNAAAWANLQSLVNLLDVPAFHIDQAHDGGASNLIAVLRTGLQRFFAARATDPWIHSSGGDNTQYPPSGPIFYFDATSANPSTDAFGTGGYIANQFASACVNFRRNHLYEHAQDSIWPVAGENLDRIQRPPIHALWSNFGTATLNGFDQPDWFIRVTYQSWINASVGMDYLTSMKAGLDVLLTQETTYPGVSRHILPTLAQGSPPLLVYPWST